MRNSIREACLAKSCIRCFLRRNTRWFEHDLTLCVEKETNKSLCSPKLRTLRLKAMKRLHRKIWTPEEDNLLRTLLENGRSVAKVAETLNRTVTAIKGRASLLRISRKQKAGSKIKADAS